MEQLGGALDEQAEDDVRIELATKLGTHGEQQVRAAAALIGIFERGRRSIAAPAARHRTRRTTPRRA